MAHPPRLQLARSNMQGVSACPNASHTGVCEKQPFMLSLALQSSSKNYIQPLI